MDLARRLHEEALATNERRLLVLTGEAEPSRQRAREAIESAGIEPAATTYVGPTSIPGFESLGYDAAKELLGSTRTGLIVDCHDRCEPNLLASLVGVVDGGGLLILLTPPLDTWPNETDEFDASLAPPPTNSSQVGGNFRTRLVETLRAHRGIAIVGADANEIQKSGCTDPPPRLPPAELEFPVDPAFPRVAYKACRTQDQVVALEGLESLRTPEQAIVLESDRGRGKSSVAGLAAASLAHKGNSVIVTAPQYRNVRELFARARELRERLAPEIAGTDNNTDNGNIEFDRGSIRYEPPLAAAELATETDHVIVDEAAALPVAVLESFLTAESVAFATTVHGYEGTGRGFAVRFRETLAESEFFTKEIILQEPIRYAAGDPIEVWSFRAFALGARPPVAEAVAEAAPNSVTYQQLSASDLMADEPLLNEVFGLLVQAHYRTEPNDLARLLDAPNVSIHALMADGHQVAVCLLAEEGGLDDSIRERMYTGQRVKGNLIPDVLSSQLRDVDAGTPVGQRILRIATHESVQSRGLGSLLVDRVREHTAADWLGVGYGGTPDLVSFWRSNGFHTVHVATSRNERSGEHSIIMLDPRTETGQALVDRHTDWFLRRFPATLTDALDDLNADVVREACGAVAKPPELEFSTFERKILAGIPVGAAILETAPGPVRELAIRHLFEPRAELSPQTERLLVRRVLQAQPWEGVTDALGYESERTCKRAFGTAIGTLLETYGDDEFARERERLE